MTIRELKTFVLLPLALVALVIGATSRARAEVDPAVLAAEQARIAVIEKASQAALAIMAPGGQGGGSGVVISPDGYALSNFHVTHEAGAAMKCGMADGRLYDAVIVGLDPGGDVALLKVLGRDDFPHAELGDSDRMRAGDWCLVIGNPFLLATDFKPTVTFGVISGVHRYQYPAGTLLEYTDCLQADAAINPGNSGGPMFDLDGKLIGINGRGSFEKRGRVNVGVGYAISINQIKNFLGNLKSGRIVDHATLGAVVSSREGATAIVDDILEESDAYRRGLRLGDEIVRFAGREITSPNALKNILGIFPDGWRVPLVYRRQGALHTIFVRLRGLHAPGELLALLEAEGKAPGPGKPKKRDPKKDDKPGPHDPETPGVEQAHKPRPMPDIVKKHYQKKPGFVNYYFNKLELDRVWKSLTGRGEFTEFKTPWTLKGELRSGGDFELVLDHDSAAIRMPGGALRLKLGEKPSELLEPPASGGLLVAATLWERLLRDGAAAFAPLEYAGAAPLMTRPGLYDVLSATFKDVECRFYVDSPSGQLAAMEMIPDPDVDPCEISFEDYREHSGRMLPHRFVVRHGDTVYQIFEVAEYRFGEEQAK